MLVPFASRHATQRDSTSNNVSGSEVENARAAVYTSSRRAGTFAASIFVAPPGIHFLHAPIWKSCRNRKREKDSTTSISQDEFSRRRERSRWLLSRMVPDTARYNYFTGGSLAVLAKWKTDRRAYVVEKRLRLSYVSLCNQLDPCKIHRGARPCSRAHVLVARRYLSSREELGIDNELVEKSSDTSFPVFVLIDLSSRPYPFSTILRVFRQLYHFLFLYFLDAQFITDRARKEYLNVAVATMNRW